MELAICSFASSSAGNSFLIQSQSTRILADIGISAKKTEESLAACGLSCVELDGIVLTHEHIDHVRGIGTLLAKKPYRGPVFTTRGTCESVAQKYPQTEGKQFEIVRSGDRFFVGDIEVNVLRISHDAAVSGQSCYRADWRGLRAQLRRHLSRPCKLRAFVGRSRADEPLRSCGICKPYL